MTTRRSLSAAALLAALASAGGCPRPAPRGQTPHGEIMDDYPAEPPPEEPEPRAEAAAPVEHIDDVMRLHVIDVGQGAAELVEFPCGAILVDTGGEKNRLFDGEKALLDYLDRFFARRHDLDRTLALLVISHPDIDHTRGIAALLASYRVLNVLDNGDGRDDEGGKPQLAMHEWLSRHPRIGHLDLSRSDIDDRDGVTGPVIDPVGTCGASEVDPIVRALWSGDIGRDEGSREPSDDSLVLKIDFGDVSALLPGDIELPAISRLIKKYRNNPRLLDADIFLVPNHGSRNSSSANLLARVSPQVAVITAGPYDRQVADDQFTARALGLPSQVAVDQLTADKTGVRGKRPAPVQVWVGQHGAWKGRPGLFEKRTISAAVYATSWDGTVVVTGHASGWIEVATER